MVKEYQQFETNSMLGQTVVELLLGVELTEKQCS